MEMNLRTLSQPNPRDKDELEIRKKLENLVSTDWAKDFIISTKEKQREFLENQLTNTAEELTTRASYLELIDDICNTGKTKITTGVEHLASLKDKPFILITNHLGMAKLSRIALLDLNTKVEALEEIEPFPIRVAPLSLITKKTGLDLHECAVELPEPFLDIQKTSGVVTIPSVGKGRTDYLQAKIGETLKVNPKSLFVMYPEGGTSGKRNHGGPYDLDVFHSGSFVIATYLELPILPVFQSFDPNRGFELNILPTINPSILNTSDLKVITEQTRLLLQQNSPKI